MSLIRVAFGEGYTVLGSCAKWLRLVLCVIHLIIVAVPVLTVIVCRVLGENNIGLTVRISSPSCVVSVMSHSAMCPSCVAQLCCLCTVPVICSIRMAVSSCQVLSMCAARMIFVASDHLGACLSAILG